MVPMRAERSEAFGGGGRRWFTRVVTSRLLSAVRRWERSVNLEQTLQPRRSDDGGPTRPPFGHGGPGCVGTASMLTGCRGRPQAIRSKAGPAFLRELAALPRQTVLISTH